MAKFKVELEIEYDESKTNPKEVAQIFSDYLFEIVKAKDIEDDLGELKFENFVVKSQKKN